MLNVLILHAWLNTAKDNWYPWLRKKFRTIGYNAQIPRIPTMNTKHPNLSRQLRFLEKNFRLSKDSIVIGHSLGALLALRLGESRRLHSLYLVAGWDINDLTSAHQSFWKRPINHKKIIRHTKKRFIFHSDNDPYFTKFQAKEMAKRLSGEFVLVKNAGHFSGKKIEKIYRIFSKVS